MKEKIQQSHVLISSTITLAGGTTSINFFVLSIYLAINIVLKRSYPLNLLIGLYVLCLLSCEYVFWKEWKSRISKSLKTENWTISIKNHINLWIAFVWITFDVFAEIFLIKKALNFKLPIILTFLALILSKSIGSIVQSFECRVIGRKNTIIISSGVLFCIIFILFSNKEILSPNILFSMIIIKGLLVNLAIITKTIIADQIEIKYR